ALRLHAAAGGPESAPIFFSIDEDIDLDTWKSVAADWLRGINSVLGVNRTGVYGHSRVCAWAIDDGVIGPSTSAGHWWAWQTRAWSGGEREPRAVLYQAVVVTGPDTGIPMGGTQVDENEVLAADFGQWDLDRT
ncbi:glycoside hydrolase domain-containing protein, partial [Mycolicibacterium pulveris]